MIRLYGLVSDQVRVAPSGSVIGLDDCAVLSVLKLHGEDTQEMFEKILTCHRAEQEYAKENE